MRLSPFYFSRHALALLLVINLVLLGTSIYLGFKSANQMREIVKEDFNQQQLVLARHTAGLLGQDLNFLKRELSTLNFSPSIQYLEPLTWANRMRATLSSVREEGVVEIRRLNREGTRAYLVDARGVDHVITGAFQNTPYLEWARLPEHKGRIYVRSRFHSRSPTMWAGSSWSWPLPPMRNRWTKAIPTLPGAMSGALLFYIDAHILANKFTRQIRSGKTGYAWIMDNQGTFLSHPERDFIGKNAFTVRKERMPAISFDAINEIQREKMLAGQEGWGTYISGWHRGLAGEIQKLIAYAPVKLDRTFPRQNQHKADPSWSVAVVAPASEVEGVVHSLYLRQFFLQVIIGFFVLSGTIVMLNFRYERQFSAVPGGGSQPAKRETPEIRGPVPGLGGKCRGPDLHRGR